MRDSIKNIGVRTISGGALILIIAALTLFSSYSFAALTVAIIGGCTFELYRMAQAGGLSPDKRTGIIVTMAVAVVNIAQIEIFSFSETVPTIGLSTLLVMPIAMVVTLFAEMMRNKQNAIINGAITLIPLIYIALPLSVMGLIPRLLNQGEWNGLIMFTFFCTMWANDTFAYLFGVCFGKHLLIERISPKKTVEGLVGGIIGAIGIALIASIINNGNPYIWAGLGLVSAIGGVIGDLVESMIKRSLNQKDSGSFIPGHGGWLDRFDSWIIAVPLSVLYLYIMHLLKLI